MNKTKSRYSRNSRGGKTRRNTMKKGGQKSKTQKNRRMNKSKRN